AVPNGTSVAYLTRVSGSPGKIEIHLGSLSNPAVSPNPFDYATGQDGIDWGSNSNWTLIDQTSGTFKPTGDGNGDQGIYVHGGTGGTVRVEGGPLDDRMDVYDSGGGFSTVSQSGGGGGYVKLGAGVRNVDVLPFDDYSEDFPAPTGLYHESA